MNTEVKKENVNGTIVFNYKGIEVDKTTWESAPIPICCKNIDDESMCCIVRTLYDIIVQEYGQDYMDKYIAKDEDFIKSFEWDNVDDFRWTEEEQLFIEWGGVYYEDLN